MTAGARECHISAPGTPLVRRVRTPEVVFTLGSPADFGGLGITFCGAFKQSGTATASATVSIHETERNRPFT